MRKKRGNLMNGLGSRLKELRKHLDFSVPEMAARLGINAISYYKNESDAALPGAVSLHRLHKDFNVSMDWLLFGSGPMLLEQKQEGMEEISAWEKLGPEVKELVAAMDKDPLLRHEILSHFYKYKRGGESDPTNYQPEDKEKGGGKSRD